MPISSACFRMSVCASYSPLNRPVSKTQRRDNGICALEGLAGLIVAWSGVVAPYDELIAAVIAPDDRVPHSFLAELVAFRDKG